MTSRPGFIFAEGVGYPEHEYLKGLEKAESFLGLDAIERALKANRECAVAHICHLVDPDFYDPARSETVLAALAARDRRSAQ